MDHNYNRVRFHAEALGAKPNPFHLLRVTTTHTAYGASNTVTLMACDTEAQATRIAAGLNACLTALLTTDWTGPTLNAAELAERTADERGWGEPDAEPRYISEHPADAVLFICWSEDEGEENANAPATLAEYLADNVDDRQFCDWLRRAEVGDTFRTGGGAAPIIVTRRVLG